jgi:hypothetical protein
LTPWSCCLHSLTLTHLQHSRLQTLCTERAQGLEDAAGGGVTAAAPKVKILVDGANLAWGYGQAVSAFACPHSKICRWVCRRDRSVTWRRAELDELLGADGVWLTQVHARFKGGANKAMIPLSQGVLMALDHPQWAEYDVKAIMPYSYVQGTLRGLADGRNRSLNADKVRFRMGPSRGGG